MGFLTPGKSTKRRTKEHKDNIRVKRVKLKSQSMTLQQTRPPTPVLKQVEEKKSILERFPVEIVHELFVLSGINSLPFVCKSLNYELQPTNSLRVEMLRKYVHDLNSDIPALSEEYRTRYALDRRVLDYRFATGDALAKVSFDTVLTEETINAEKMNRLVLYYDKLSKMMLDTLKRADASEDEVNEELARIAREREMLKLDDVELSDLALEQVMDFPEKFYNGQFNELRMSSVEQLHNRAMKFVDGERVMSCAINQGCKLDILERLLACTETGRISTSLPLIIAFEQDNLELVEWLLSHSENDSILIDDDLWKSLLKNQNTEHLHFVEKRGGVPSHEVLAAIAAVSRP